MVEGTEKARSRILAAAVELLQEQGVSEVTMRTIADRAGVGLGLINYHFGSKDELIYEAVSAIMGETVDGWHQPQSHPQVDSETRLRHLIRESGRVVDRFPQYFQIPVRRGLLEADFDNVERILPLLQQVFGSGRRELELRLIAFSLMVSIQMALLRPEAFERYCGLDLFDAEQRELAFEMMVNIALAQG